MEEGVRSPAGQPDAAAGINPEWHCGNDKEGDQEAKSGEGLREIHSGNASVPPALPWRRDPGMTSCMSVKGRKREQRWQRMMDALERIRQTENL